MTLYMQHRLPKIIFQGGLEMACEAAVVMPGIMKNHTMIDWHFELVRSQDAEPKNEVILGAFLSKLDMSLTTVNNDDKRKAMAQGRQRNLSYQQK